MEVVGRDLDRWMKGDSKTHLNTPKFASLENCAKPDVKC